MEVTMSTPVNNLSYTNKDFSSIYNELLDSTAALTNKWSPRDSNESDPGVVLLKELALVADKNNYNIDKNILEAFPQTVTQEYNARNLYQQLGYKMPWYRSATGQCAFKWVHDVINNDDSVVIPAFTMLTDSNTDYIFTTTQQVVFTRNVDEQSVPVIEGTLVNYSINNNSVIPLTALDYNNRLYLGDYNVAENGVFVSTSDNATAFWTQVDNIMHQPVGSRCYEFCVDSRNNICYLQFPDDISSLIGKGLLVKYLTSAGVSGNIGSKVLESFYSEITVQYAGAPIPVNDSVIRLQNSAPCTGGSDPETVEEAYRSYRRVAGTFDTLVTTRDYENAIVNSGLVSNAIVSDRYSDIQSSYKVVTEDTVNPVHTYVVKEEKYVTLPKIDGTGDVQVSMEAPEMTAFDLRIYGLQPVYSAAEEYDKSFDVIQQGDLQALTTPETKKYRTIVNYLQGTKCVNHDFKEFEPHVPLLFRNDYNLNIKLVTTSALDESSQTKVRLSVLKALRTALSSNAIDFGTGVNYSDIESIVKGADNRIVNVLLDRVDYVTFAIYWDGTAFKEIPVSENGEYSSYCLTIGSDERKEGSSSYDYTKVLTKIQAAGLSTFDESILLYEEDRHYFYKLDKTSKTVNVYSTLLNNFRSDIIAKSILAGKTQLFDIDDKFDTYVDQQFVCRQQVDRLTSYLYINTASTDMAYNATSADSIKYSYPSVEDGAVSDVTGSTNIVVTEDTNPNLYTYTLKDHEALRLYGPSLKEGLTYANYVKFEVVLNTPRGGCVTGGLSPELSYWMKRNDTFIQDRAIKAYASITWPDVLDEFETRFKAYLKGMRDLELTKLPAEWTLVSAENCDAGTDEGIQQYVLCFMLSLVNVEIGDTTYSFSGGGIVIPTDTIYDSREAFKIAADQSYQLQAGDDCTFFWRGEDTEGEESPYQYRRYVGTAESNSPIICPSFTLYGTPAAQRTVKNLNADIGYIPYDSREGSNFQIVYNMYGANDLSGSKSIVTKEVNEITLKADSYHAFISNIRDKDKCYLVLKHVPHTADIYQYILQQDEYFINVNRRQDSLEIYNPGTCIRIKSDNQEKSPIQLSCNLLDYRTVLNNGMAELKEALQPNGREIMIREQVMYTLVSGTTLQMSCPAVFTSWEPTFIDNSTTIEYYSGNSQPINVPQIKLNDNTQWVAMAELHIEQAVDSPQQYVLVGEDKKSIQLLLLKNSEDAWAPIKPLSANTLSEPFYVQSDFPLSMVGGFNVDVSYKDGLMQEKQPELYVYSLSATSNAKCDYSNGKLYVSLSDANEIQLPANWGTGNHLLVVKRSDNLTYSLDYYATRGNVSSSLIPNRVVLQNSDSASPYDYYIITVEADDGDSFIGVRKDDESESGEILFVALNRVSDNMLDSDVLDAVKRLDYQSKFKYNYVVPDNERIDDPLLAESFFDANHFANKYCIAKAICSYNVLNASEVLFMNTR